MLVRERGTVEQPAVDRDGLLPVPIPAGPQDERQVLEGKGLVFLE
jgi:hypothetical protein